MICDSEEKMHLSHMGEVPPVNQALFSDTETILTRYQNWVSQTIQKNLNDEVYQKTLLPIIEEERPYAGSVALSVVMRTQGRRPEALREALQCLYAQSCQDFELILVAHKPNEQQLAAVNEILDELEPKFRKQVRLYVLEFGQRSMPLNIGFAHARGGYIAVLDDDDLVMENWVLEFVKAAREHPGRVLHAYGFDQDWKIIKQEHGVDLLQSTKAPSASYCENFELTRQLLSNHCPLINLCFPRTAFADYGFIFNDALTTVEDWDCFMRTVLLFGVADIEEPTSIYRLWKNLESSHTLHNRQEWWKNQKYILDQLRECYVLMEPANVDMFISKKYPKDFELEIEDTEAMTVDEAELADNPTLEDVLGSTSWKIGRLITYIPRKIKGFCIDIKETGMRKAVQRIGTGMKALPKVVSAFFRR